MHDRVDAPLRGAVQRHGPGKKGAPTLVALRSLWRVAASAALLAVVGTGCAFAPAPSAPGDSFAAQTLVLLNANRAPEPPLAYSDALAGQAQAWASHLASCTPVIADQNVATLFPVLPGFHALAENSLFMAASYGPSQADFYFVFSPPHDANLMGPYDFVGVGHVTYCGRAFVVELFGAN